MQNFTTGDGRHVKNVFLPVYGIPLDEAAKQTYSARGLKVIPLTLAAFTSIAGAIRCMANYLGRSEAVQHRAGASRTAPGEQIVHY